MGGVAAGGTHRGEVDEHPGWHDLRHAHDRQPERAEVARVEALLVAPPIYIYITRHLETMHD